MAHLRDIRVPRCHSSGCPKAATVTLYSTRNATYGDYCKRHGNEALKRLQKQEDADARA